MRAFMVLLRKEIKELLTFQMLVPFAITVLVFVFIGNVIGGETGDASAPTPVTVVDLDASQGSTLVVQAIEQAGFDVRPSDASPEVAIEALKAEDAETSFLVVIPAGFGETLLAGERPALDAYSAIRNFSFTGAQDAALLEGAIGSAGTSVGHALLEREAPGLDPAVIERPIVVTDHVIVGGKSAEGSPAEVVAFISQQTTFIPIILFLVIVFAAQMIAGAIASEKENKTLETLLAMPVGRGALVTAKMLAAATIALLSAGAYMAGMLYYMRNIQESFGAGTGPTATGSAALEQLGLSLGVGDWVLLGLTVFVAILVALAVAIVLGGFADNVRAAQSLLAPLMLLLMIPYFLVLFLDVSTVSPLLRYLIYAIPFSHPFMAGPNLFLDNYAMVWFGIAYETVWFLVFVVIAARIFSSDRILTMKLDLGKKRSRRSGRIA
ncbi:MAG: ABC transporter permease [Anaerosomatales bacterium]|nr:ABC transporter permease [Anaerosomatales bacterium]